MREINVKKILLLNLPYFFIGLYTGKIWQAWRLTTGANASEKLLHIADGFGLAFQSPLPSFYFQDLTFGLICALFLRLAVSIHSQNTKKFRKGVEYGSARWGTAADIISEHLAIANPAKSSIAGQSWSRQSLVRTNAIVHFVVRKCCVCVLWQALHCA